MHLIIPLSLKSLNIAKKPSCFSSVMISEKKELEIKKELEKLKNKT